MNQPTENNTQTSNIEKHPHGLYYVIPAAIMDREDLNPMAKLLYALLSGLANEDGHCFPSDNYLSKRLHVVPRQIKRLLSQLEELGLVSRKTTSNISNPFKKFRLITIHSDFKKPSAKASQVTSDGDKNVTSEVKKMSLIESEAILESKEKDPPAPPKEGVCEWISFPPLVKLRKIDYEDFVLKKGKQTVDQFIEEMNDYLIASGKKYKDYAAALRNWFRRHQKESKSSGSTDCIKKDKALAERIKSKFSGNPNIIVGYNYIEFLMHRMGIPDPHLVFGENGFAEQVENNLRKMGLKI